MPDDLLQNITTEDVLQKQIEQFRALAENSPDIIARFDRDFRYLYINRPVFNTKIGRIAARIVDSIDDIGLPENEIELRKQKIRYVFETEQPTSFEFRFPGISGNQWFEARFAPEFSPDGTVASVLMISQDISRRKQTEDALQKTIALLNEAQELARIGQLGMEFGVRCRILPSAKMRKNRFGKAKKNIVLSLKQPAKASVSLTKTTILRW